MTTSRIILQLRMFLFGAFILSIYPAHANSASNRTVNVKFACARVSQGLSELAYLSKKEDSGIARIQLNVHYLSSPVKLKADAKGEVKLYAPSELLNAEEDVQPAVRFKVSAKSKEVLVLLLPNAKKGGPVYHAKIIQTDERFGYGCACVVNLTKGDVYFKESSRKKPLKIGKGGNVVLGTSGQASQSHVELGVAKGDTKKVRRFYSATWTQSSSVREICLVYQKPGKKWPSTKVIAESRPMQLN